MKIAIMQPYFLPYMGYFQLLHAVDEFIFFDDVNYIKKGWINRNNFLVQDHAHLFSVSLRDASQNKLIKDVGISYESRWKDTFLNMLIHNYSKAKHFDVVFKMLKLQLDKDFEYISDLNMSLVVAICNYLGIQRRFSKSSDIDYDKKGSGEKKIVSICQLKQATHYVNAWGGRALYEKEHFKSEHIHLSFIKSHAMPYKQKGDAFVPNLSIVDALMYCDKEEVNKMVNAYSLI